MPTIQRAIQNDNRFKNNRTIEYELTYIIAMASKWKNNGRQSINSAVIKTNGENVQCELQTNISCSILYFFKHR